MDHIKIIKKHLDDIDCPTEHGQFVLLCDGNIEVFDSDTSSSYEVEFPKNWEEDTTLKRELGQLRREMIEDNANNDEPTPHYLPQLATRVAHEYAIMNRTS